MAQPDHRHRAQPESQAPAYHYPQGHHPHATPSQGHHAQDQYSPDGYAADTSGSYQPFSRPAGHPPFFGEQPPADSHQPSPYAARFEDYLGNRHHEQPAPGYDDQALAQLQPAGQPRRPHATLRDQLQSAQSNHWHQAQSSRDRAPRGRDPRDYDLGSYMPAGADGDPAPYGNGHAQPHGGDAEPHWQDQHRYGVDHGVHPAAGAADYYAQVGGESLPVEQVSGLDGQDADDLDDYDYEEPGRSRRGLLIVGALVGAIVVGGGLAYGYKTIVGPTPKGTPPVIKADARPAKSQPEDPGGRQFAHSDSKLMGRLDPDRAASNTSGSAQASTLSDEEGSGVRRVPTIVVGRDGSIAPPAEPRLPPATVAVPGMTIVNGFGGRPTMQPLGNSEPERAPEVPPAPRIIAKASPEPQALAPAAQPTRLVPPPPVRSADVVAPPSRPEALQPKVQQPAPKQAAATAATPAPKSTPVGYVAVLASQKSRIDALKTFADLQQRYMHVLQNKIPDVLEADLSARGLGTMYRVVVGPPGSREAAADLCGQLKSAGFQGCWITTY